MYLAVTGSVLADAMKWWLFFVAFLPGVCFAGSNGKKIVPLDQKYNQVVITTNPLL